MTHSASLLLAFPGQSPGDRDSPLAPLINALEAANHEVLTLPMDPAAPDEENEGSLRAILETRESESMVLGGFSLGARMVVGLAAEFAPRGLLLLGYPFHRLGDPGDHHGLKPLQKVTVPTLVMQGSRDPHGTHEEVKGYRELPSGLRVHWLENGNHVFRPRKASGLTLEAHHASAAEASLRFLSELGA